MKLRIALCLIFCYVYYICATQHSRVREHRQEAIIIIEIQEVAHPQSQQAEVAIVEDRRYQHKKKLACIGFATALVAAGTAITIYLTK